MQVLAGQCVMAYEKGRVGKGMETLCLSAKEYAEETMADHPWSLETGSEND